MRWQTALFAFGIQCGGNDPPPVAAPWSDAFDRTGLGVNYYKSGAGYEIRDGSLSARRARNHPLWLRKKLPRDVRIEFDCWSNDARGDIKVELFGDGRSFDANGGRYTASGYELIFGGWSNRKSMIARRDEHATDAPQRVLPQVVPGQRYRWTIERRGHTLTWWIDLAPNSLRRSAVPLGNPGPGRQPSSSWGIDLPTGGQPSAGDDAQSPPFLTYVDSDPLEGTGHEYFGFNNWETDTWFDNLVVSPL